MPVEIRVKDFTSQVGQTQLVAVDNLKAIDPAVVVQILREYNADPAYPSGVVFLQTVEHAAVEIAGGPEDSSGTIVTLTVSLGPGTWFELAANAIESQRTRYAPFLAVAADFPSGTVRMWTGYGNLEIDGAVYCGVGELGRIDSEIERSNLTTDSKTYELAGAMVDPALLSEDDIDNSYGRPIVEYLGFLNPDDHTLVALPEIRFEGEISTIARADTDEPVIRLVAESRTAALDRNDGWRYTHEHQQQFYEGDLGCEPASRNDMRDVLWNGHRVGAGVSWHGGGGRDRERDRYREP